MSERRYCKNKTKGSRPGRKWDAKTRAGCMMDMIGSNNICAVARKWGVPESTIRTWMAEELDKPPGQSVFAEARRRAAREIAVRAAAGAARQVAYLQQRVEANSRNAEICERLHRRLDEDVRARAYEDVGQALATEAEQRTAAECTALVVYAAPGTYDTALDENARTELEKQLERYAPMSDRDAALVARTLAEIAARAGQMDPADATGGGPEAMPPVLEIGAAAEVWAGPEVVLEHEDGQ